MTWRCSGIRPRRADRAQIPEQADTHPGYVLSALATCWSSFSKAGRMGNWWRQKDVTSFPESVGCSGILGINTRFPWCRPINISTSMTFLCKPRHTKRVPYIGQSWDRYSWEAWSARWVWDADDMAASRTGSAYSRIPARKFQHLRCRHQGWNREPSTLLHCRETYRWPGHWSDQYAYFSASRWLSTWQFLLMSW